MQAMQDDHLDTMSRLVLGCYLTSLIYRPVFGTCYVYVIVMATSGSHPIHEKLATSVVSYDVLSYNCKRYKMY